MDRRKLCLGCSMYKKEKCGESIKNFLECPCSKCLLKMVCIFSCGELRKFLLEDLKYDGI